MPDLPETMRAVVLTGHGGLDKLEFRDDWPVPSPAPGEVLIKVGACGMNNTDVNTRSGWYSKSVTEATTGGAYAEQQAGDSTWGGAGVRFPRIQGADTVGEVVAVGAGADTALIGQAGHGRLLAARLGRPAEPRSSTGYFGSERDGGYRRVRHRRSAQCPRGREHDDGCGTRHVLVLLHHGRGDADAREASGPMTRFW